MNLNDLIVQLPEMYQPIYGHPDLACTPSRPCEDRLHYIISVYNALQNLLHRPLRVLDLGCAQGYFSFSLAAHGAEVHGIDYCHENISLCNALAQENPKLRVSFEFGRIEEFINNIEIGEFDLVLGLSVFHHIIHESGADYVRKLLRELSYKVFALILEFGLSSEPVYWASSQPADPRYLIQDIAFVHEISKHATHLSNVLRPLYFASNFFWYIDEHVGRIESWSDASHALVGYAHQGTRRFYFSGDKIIKVYKIKKGSGGIYQLNQEEFEREVRILRQPPIGFSVPKLITAGNNDSEAWLIRELIPGEILLDVILNNRTYEPTHVLMDILHQCRVLEMNGFYHNDIRTWNVVVSPDGSARLIDYGSITEQPKDCVWPINIFLSFFIFAYEVTVGKVCDPTPIRIPAFTPSCFESPYREWIAAFVSQPLSTWSFDMLFNLFNEFVVQTKEGGPQDFNKYNEEYIKNVDAAIAQYASIISKYSSQLESELNAERSRASQLESELDAERSRASQLESELDAERSRASQLESELDAERSRASQLENELHTVYSTRSWRLTQPLRAAFCMMLRMRSRIVGIPQAVKGTVAQMVNRSLLFMIRFVISHPSLKYRAVSIVKKSRRLDEWAHRFVISHGLADHSKAAPHHPVALSPELEDLSLHARCIYINLKDAIERSRRNIR